MLRIFSLIFFPFSAHASEASGPGLTGANYLNALLALFLILGLLAGLAWLTRKFAGGSGFGHGGMKIVGGVTLGPRERIVLVEVGESWLVIGIVPGQIRTLHRLPKGTDFDISQRGLPDTPPFANWLKTITERGKNT